MSVALIIHARTDRTATYYTVSSDLLSEDMCDILAGQPEFLVPLSQNFKLPEFDEDVCALLGHVKRIGPPNNMDGYPGGLSFAFVPGAFENTLFLLDVED